jgi:hypothetical protein
MRSMCFWPVLILSLSLSPTTIRGNELQMRRGRALHGFTHMHQNTEAQKRYTCMSVQYGVFYFQFQSTWRSAVIDISLTHWPVHNTQLNLVYELSIWLTVALTRSIREPSTHSTLWVRLRTRGHKVSGVENGPMCCGLFVNHRSWPDTHVFHSLPSSNYQLFNSARSFSGGFNQG